ncbi:hypothetical protein Sgly_1429 [Syntrophobotulus glycolicus DSM 8271]|uniref:TIR domain-containing protein n=1 Tax=Syntrophobotulus glycolicus (strain DSM 8271 / FlGlyR) TaxID=645991 RepID=F0SWG5_SYNGF|nr:toll/interleukin-1 receptor domain-containing protein [Syntrophobotulus glycolicus]ADY55731.1 hypothetical protein Sgly_1429 [Syntrophobotulus glycolicus DSM 8271]
MSKIFLSFTTSDAGVVSFYEQALIAAGHEVFRFDHGGLRAGDPSDQIIARRIREYDYIFVFLSEAYISKPYTIKELNQTVYEENELGKIKMIMIRIDLKDSHFPRILNRGPFAMKNRFYFNAAEGEADAKKLEELLMQIDKPGTLLEKSQCYCLRIPKDGLKIFHFGEKYNEWELNIPDLLFFEGIGIYFLFNIDQKGLEFKNYIQFTETEYDVNNVTKILRDENLKVDGSNVELIPHGGHIRNVFFLDQTYAQRKNGKFTNNVW